MPSTCQTIIDNGFAKSSAARPELMGAPAEFVGRIGQCLREIFQVISRENPTLLGTAVSVGFAAGGWARPSDCLRVIKVQADGGTVAVPTIASGTEITVVPYDDQGIVAGDPSVTELGQAFVATGQSVDPSGGSLTIVYARSPIQPSIVSDTIDPLFPSMFDDFLQLDMAAYLASKDKRTEDEQTFLGQKNAILSQIIDWCQQQTYSIVQRFPLVAPPSTNTNHGRQPSTGQ